MNKLVMGLIVALGLSSGAYAADRQGGKFVVMSPEDFLLAALCHGMCSQQPSEEQLAILKLQTERVEVEDALRVASSLCTSTMSPARRQRHASFVAAQQQRLQAIDAEILSLKSQLEVIEAENN